MPTDPSEAPQSRATGCGHETRDARAGWILALVVGLFIVGIAVHFVLSGVLNVFERNGPPVARPEIAAREAKASLPKSPRFPPLQVNPPADLNAFRAREDRELDTYGWINKTAGVVRIPIARAMDLVLERGLPTRNSTNAEHTGPSSWELQQKRAAPLPKERRTQQ